MFLVQKSNIQQEPAEKSISQVLLCFKCFVSNPSKFHNKSLSKWIHSRTNMFHELFSFEAAVILVSCNPFHIYEPFGNHQKFLMKSSNNFKIRSSTYIAQDSSEMGIYIYLYTTRFYSTSTGSLAPKSFSHCSPAS